MGCKLDPWQRHSTKRIHNRSIAREDPAGQGALFDKRLLHVIRSIDPAVGGPTVGMEKLAEASGKTPAGDPAMELVCLDDPREEYVRGHSFPVHALGPGRGHYGYTPRLQPWVSENLSRFDGVVIHGLWLYHSYGTYRAVHRRSPYVIFPHGMLDPYFKQAFPLKHLKKQAYWLAREYRVLRDARAVCFTTPVERDLAAGTLWPNRWNAMVASFGISAPVGDPAVRAGGLSLPISGARRTQILSLSLPHSYQERLRSGD